MKRIILALVFAFYATGALAQNPGVTFNPNVVTAGHGVTIVDKFHLRDNGIPVINVMTYIPQSYWAAIEDGTSVVDVGAYLQTAFDAANTAIGGEIDFPCGLFNTGRVLFLHSNQLLRGAGACSQIVATAEISSANTNAPVPYSPFGTSKFMLSNYDWSSGNINIAVRDISFSLVNANNGGNHNVHFYNVNGLIIKDSFAAYGGDGFSGNLVTNFTVSNSSVINASNGALDVWDNSSNVSFLNNYVYCNGAAAGILFTGITTVGSSGTTSNVRAIGNTIDSCNSQGIWVQGGVGGTTTASFTGVISGTALSVSGVTGTIALGQTISGSGITAGTYILSGSGTSWIVNNSQTVGSEAMTTAYVAGATKDVVIANNVIKNIGTFYGIRTSEADRVTITGNSIHDIAKSAIVANAQSGGTGTSNLAISGNVITNTNTANGGVSAIWLGNLTTYSNVSANQIDVGSFPYTYGIQVDSGATNNVVGPNTIVSGANGRYLISDTSTTTIPAVIGGSTGYVIAQSAIQTSHSGDATETPLATIIIPKNSIGKNGRVRVTAMWSYTSSANTKTARIRFGASGAGIGGTQMLFSTLTTSVVYRVQSEIANVNSTVSQKANSSNGSGGFGTGGGGTTFTTAAINTAADTEIDITGQLDAGAVIAGEAINLESWMVEVFYGS